MDWTDVQGIGYLCLFALALMALVGVAPELIALKNWICSFFGSWSTTSPYEEWTAPAQYEYDYYDAAPSFIEDLWSGIATIFSKIWEGMLWFLCAIVFFCIMCFILWILYQVLKEITHAYRNNAPDEDESTPAVTIEDITDEGHLEMTEVPRVVTAPEPRQHVRARSQSRSRRHRRPVDLRMAAIENDREARLEAEKGRTFEVPDSPTFDPSKEWTYIKDAPTVTEVVKLPEPVQEITHQTIVILRNPLELPAPVKIAANYIDDWYSPEELEERARRKAKHALEVAARKARTPEQVEEDGQRQLQLIKKRQEQAMQRKAKIEAEKKRRMAEKLAREKERIRDVSVQLESEVVKTEIASAPPTSHAVIPIIRIEEVSDEVSNPVAPPASLQREAAVSPPETAPMAKPSPSLVRTILKQNVACAAEVPVPKANQFQPLCTPSPFKKEVVTALPETAPEVKPLLDATVVAEAGIAARPKRKEVKPAAPKRKEPKVKRIAKRTAGTEARMKPPASDHGPREAETTAGADAEDPSEQPAQAKREAQKMAEPNQAEASEQLEAELERENAQKQAQLEKEEEEEERKRRESHDQPAKADEKARVAEQTRIAKEQEAERIVEEQRAADEKHKRETEVRAEADAKAKTEAKANLAQQQQELLAEQAKKAKEDLQKQKQRDAERESASRKAQEASAHRANSTSMPPERTVLPGPAQAARWNAEEEALAPKSVLNVGARQAARSESIFDAKTYASLPVAASSLTSGYASASQIKTGADTAMSGTEDFAQPQSSQQTDSAFSMPTTFDFGTTQAQKSAFAFQGFQHAAQNTSHGINGLSGTAPLLAGNPGWFSSQPPQSAQKASQDVDMSEELQQAPSNQTYSFGSMPPAVQRPGSGFNGFNAPNQAAVFDFGSGNGFSGGLFGIQHTSTSAPDTQPGSGAFYPAAPVNEPSREDVDEEMHEAPGFSASAANAYSTTHNTMQNNATPGMNTLFTTGLHFGPAAAPAVSPFGSAQAYPIPAANMPPPPVRPLAPPTFSAPPQIKVDFGFVGQKQPGAHPYFPRRTNPIHQKPQPADGLLTRDFLEAPATDEIISPTSPPTSPPSSPPPEGPPPKRVFGASSSRISHPQAPLTGQVLAPAAPTSNPEVHISIVAFFVFQTIKKNPLDPSNFYKGQKVAEWVNKKFEEFPRLQFVLEDKYIENKEPYHRLRLDLEVFLKYETIFWTTPIPLLENDCYAKCLVMYWKLLLLDTSEAFNYENRFAELMKNVSIEWKANADISVMASEMSDLMDKLVGKAGTGALHDMLELCWELTEGQIGQVAHVKDIVEMLERMFVEAYDEYKKDLNVAMIQQDPLILTHLKGIAEQVARIRRFCQFRKQDFQVKGRDF